ncbi:hypothetical protein ILYODFUR_038334 [Ilyodon furcidens]|uniref:Secreted protein n=1 Tax=Ilyodon furcidens TaxID=33524 RepID=A0ABV0VCD8_9TELE
MAADGACSRYSSLGLLHCGCWVVPLGVSFALLWRGCNSPGGGPPGVPVFWWAFGCLWLRSPQCLSRAHGGRSVAPFTRYCIFLMEKLFIHKLAHTYTHRCLDSGVNRYTDVIF